MKNDYLQRSAERLMPISMVISVMLLVALIIESCPAQNLQPRSVQPTHNANANQLQPQSQPPATQPQAFTVPVPKSTSQSERFVTQPIEKASNADAADVLDQKLGESSSTDASTQPFASFLSFDSSSPAFKLIGGICIVTAIFFAFVLLAKRGGAKVNSRIPSEIFEVVGQLPLNQKQQFHLVRLGSKLLLLSVNNNHTQTISEISDPIEVEHVLSMLHKGQAAEAFNSFRRITGQMRQQRRTQRMYPSHVNPEHEYDESQPRIGGNNVFEA